MSRTSLFVSFMCGAGLVLLSAVQALTQERTLQTEGWQGKRPPPVEQRTLAPAPQRLAPTGKQVLEIPVQPQRPALPPRVSRPVCRLVSSPSAHSPSNS